MTELYYARGDAASIGEGKPLCSSPTCLGDIEVVEDLSAQQLFQAWAQLKELTRS